MRSIGWSMVVLLAISTAFSTYMWQKSEDNGEALRQELLDEQFSHGAAVMDQHMMVSTIQRADLLVEHVIGLLAQAQLTATNPEVSAGLEQLIIDFYTSRLGNPVGPEDPNQDLRHSRVLTHIALFRMLTGNHEGAQETLNWVLGRVQGQLALWPDSAVWRHENASVLSHLSAAQYSLGAEETGLQTAHEAYTAWRSLFDEGQADELAASGQLDLAAFADMVMLQARQQAAEIPEEGAYTIEWGLGALNGLDDVTYQDGVDISGFLAGARAALTAMREELMSPTPAHAPEGTGAPSPPPP